MPDDIPDAEAATPSPAFWAILPACVRYAQIAPGAKLMFAEISALQNLNGWATAGNRYFRKVFRKGDRTITRWIATLEEAGFVQVEYTRDRTDGGQVQTHRRMRTAVDQNGNSALPASIQPDLFTRKSRGQSSMVQKAGGKSALRFSRDQKNSLLDLAQTLHRQLTGETVSPIDYGREFRHLDNLARKNVDAKEVALLIRELANARKKCLYFARDILILPSRLSVHVIQELRGRRPKQSGSNSTRIQSRMNEWATKARSAAGE